MALKRTNEFWLVAGVAFIDVSTPKYPLAVALIDEIDLGRVIDGGGRWFAAGVGRHHVYVTRHADGSIQYLHQVIAGAHGTDTDHRDGDTFDNRRHNLRPADKQRNQQNSRSRAGSSSRFKGVYWRADTLRWQAQIKLPGGGKLSLGCYDDEEAAAAAYDAAALQHFGTFSRINLETVP